MIPKMLSPGRFQFNCNAAWLMHSPPAFVVDGILLFFNFNGVHTVLVLGITCFLCNVLHNNIIFLSNEIIYVVFKISNIT